MNISDIRYEPFGERDYDAVRELLCSDIETGKDILQILEQYPELFITVLYEDKLVALAQVNEPGPQSYLTVFVAPPFRRKGIGSAVVRYGESKLQAGGTQKVRSSFLADLPSSSAFARKLGYASYFSSAYMQRTGDLFPLEKLPVRLYTDEDYLPSHSMYATAFHEMRVRVGRFPDSVVAQPSEKERKAWKENAKDYFVYELNGEVVGVSHIHDNEIGSISIRTDVQGRGIGRKFVKYLCNEIYQRGYDTVKLCCVIGNDNARNLYDSLGFKEIYIKDMMVKTIT